MATDSDASRRKHRRSPSDDEADKSSKRHKHRRHHHRSHRGKKQSEERKHGGDVEEEEVAAPTPSPPPPSEIPVASGKGADYDLEEGEILEEDVELLDEKTDYSLNLGVQADKNANCFVIKSHIDNKFDNEVSLSKDSRADIQDVLASKTTSKALSKGYLGHENNKEDKRQHGESRLSSKGSGKYLNSHNIEVPQVGNNELSESRKSSSESVGEKYKIVAHSSSRDSYEEEVHTRSRSISRDVVRERSRSRSIMRDEEAKCYRRNERFDNDSDDQGLSRNSRDLRHGSRDFDRDLEKEQNISYNKYFEEDNRHRNSDAQERERSMERDVDRDRRRKEWEGSRDKDKYIDRGLRREKERERSRDIYMDKDRDRRREKERGRNRDWEVDGDRVREKKQEWSWDRELDQGWRREKEQGRSKDRDVDAERKREKASERSWERDKEIDKNKIRERHKSKDRDLYRTSERDGDREREKEKYSDWHMERDRVSDLDRESERERRYDRNRDRDRRSDIGKVHDSNSDSFGGRDRIEREEDEEDDFEERITLKLAEQEDDLNKIKEESRKRRQAILEKYRKQQLEKQNDSQLQDVKKEEEIVEHPVQAVQDANPVQAVQDANPVQAVLDANVAPETPDDRIDDGDACAADQSFSVGKSPLQNGIQASERISGAAGLGEGTPKSERSDEIYCDDIFGETPAGVRKVGKEDGLPIVRGGFHDNWDDAEGYYSYRFGEVLDGRYEVAAAHGKGVFSTVVRARDLKAGISDPEEVAIKIIRNNETMNKAGKEEVQILKKLAALDPENKRHCIRFLSSFKYRNHLCLVFESLHMNLREVLKKFGRNIGLKLTAVRAYAKQLFIALKHLKNCGVLHCDIKPDNMLVNEAKNVLKLCDFGNAMSAGKNEITPYLVSRFYRAPEIILGLPYDHPMDMWSVGCCLYELSTGKVLFPGPTNNDMLRLHMELKGPFPKKMLKKGAFVDQHFDPDLNFLATEEDPVTKKTVKRMIANIKPKDIGSIIASSSVEDPKMLASFKDLLDKIFVLDPEKRMTVSQALAHPFITGFSASCFEASLKGLYA